MSRIRILLFMSALLVLLILPPLNAVGAELTGKDLHDSQCLRCHGAEMYSREKLFVKSYRQLEAQVRVCAERNEVTWDDDQVEEVVDYLADSFYGFE